MKVVCTKSIKKFQINKTYKYDLNDGIVWSPYIISETVETIADGDFSPKKLIKSRYAINQVDNNNYQKMETDIDTKPKKTFRVFYNETYEIISEDEFIECFKTLKEYRKEKIEKLNEGANRNI